MSVDPLDKALLPRRTRGVRRRIEHVQVEQHYTVAELAPLLRLSIRTLRRAVAAGRLRAVRLGGAVRIPASAVAVFSGDEDA